jgi:acyl-CoA synthetase (AMP-forming)/AMP-acid ligase II
MNIAEQLLAQGEDAQEAILWRNKVMTYAELRERVTAVARGLLARGYQKGDRAGIFSENNPFFVAAYLGTIRAGLTAIPFQTDVSVNTFSEIASSTGMKGIFVSNRFLDHVRPWAEELELSVWTESDTVNLSDEKEARFPEITAARDLAALMFTSGSTGTPKGVMVTHRNIECNTLDIVSCLGLSGRDRVMVVLPFHYCFGLSLLHTHLLAGGSLVLNNEFKLFPETMLEELRQQECTGLAGVPSTYQILLRRSRFTKLAFPRLRWLQQAGGKLPNPCIQELIETFPQVEFFLMYGQTEGTARLSFLPPERLADKLGSIGKGLPSTWLEVLRPDGSPVAPGSDETGEIVATGDNVTKGYWNDPEESAKYFRNGKLHTGDLARVDSEGFIYIVERERDIVKSGGYRISAKEIEDVIAELSEVIEVAVVGSPHGMLGEAIIAFVVPTRDRPLTVHKVKAHCRRRLPMFKLPEEVIFLEAMPHNGSGKILKRELKGILEHRPSEGIRHQERPRPTRSLQQVRWDERAASAGLNFNCEQL